MQAGRQEKGIQMGIREYLKQHRLVTDGAMGTYYAEKKRSASLVSEWANLTEPEVIAQIHREYLEAGAVLLRTNTFAAGRSGLGISGEEQEELVRAACRIAKQEIAAFTARMGRECFLAGDIGPLRSFSETGGEESTKEEYEALIDIFLSEGVDAVLFETFSEIDGIAEAAIYAKRKNPGVFCMAEFSVNKNGYSAAGQRAGRLLELADGIAELDAVGLNCGVGSGHMLSLLEGIRLPENKYFCVSPNAGYPEQLQNRMVFMRNAGYFAENMKRIAERGAAVIGACCGSSPEYIRELALLAGGLPAAKKGADLRPGRTSADSDPAGEGKADLRPGRTSADSDPAAEREADMQACARRSGIPESGSGAQKVPADDVRLPASDAGQRDILLSEPQKQNGENGGDSAGGNRLLRLFDRRRRERELFLAERSDQSRAKEGSAVNHIRDACLAGKVIAVELDPPYDADDSKLLRAAFRLKELGADVLTIADSPQGRSRMDSVLTAVRLQSVTGMTVMPHICCRDKNMIAMRATLLGAYANDIRSLLLVTGDPVPGELRSRAKGVFDYNSMKLMSFVREMNGEHFSREPIIYGGAVNQGRLNFELELERVRKKIAAGASYFLTQPVYDAGEVQRLRRLKEETGTRLLAGIMPLVSFRNANFVKNEMVGIEVPDGILAEYRPDMSREEGEKTGVRIALRMMELLKDIADGYYFMLPFNRVSLMEELLGGKD